MQSLVYTTSRSEKELLGIMELQKQNLPANLTTEEISSQGFVTVIHSLGQLKIMNEIEQHIICKDRDKVVAYLLAMTSRSRNDIPVLIPMFEIFEKVLYLGKPLSFYNYIVVGQVCVDKNYRGKGILDICYDTYRNAFKGKYDFAITEISIRNSRSINAHNRMGFIEIHRYTSPNNEEWSVVILQW